MKHPVPPPPADTILATILGKSDGAARIQALLGAGIGPAPGGKYRHWDTFRQVKPPEGFDLLESWLAVKLARKQLYHELPLLDHDGRPFVYALPSAAIELLHLIDRDSSGTIQVSEQVTNPQTRDTYLVKSLTEEAITSSQLEGASTTRVVAKELIRSRRDPRDRSERMILNNFMAMERIRTLAGSDLTPDVVLSLQATVTDGTLDTPDAAGRLRRTDEPIVVADETTGLTLHSPPPARELARRLERMCEFANGGGGEFIHPVVRAVMLHFWVGYDHPFVDGNGRTARALFYWAMARHGYWLAEFTSISRILRQGRAAYARAFLYTESDENDATYFLLNQMRVFHRAVGDLHTFLKQKQEQIQAAELAIRTQLRLRQELNARQLALVGHALRTPGAWYTVESHRHSHAVVYETARTDLLELVRRGLLTQSRRGRTFFFEPTSRLRALAAGSS